MRPLRKYDEYQSPMTDRPYHGPITTAFDRRILQSPRIPYFCAQCAGVIEVPTGGDLCEPCFQQTEG